MISYQEQYNEYKREIETALDSLLPSDGSKTTEAMRYSLLSGGKRLRGVLVLAVARTFGCDSNLPVYAGAAIEMLHCYSLIHDDMPCMDNDDLRRGLPSCHKKYGETVALLAGDALQAKAFEVLGTYAPQLTAILARAAGNRGMCYGQELDLLIPEKERDKFTLDNINLYKTGALINASVLMGYFLCENLDEDNRKHLSAYADFLGKAFQVEDDILDVTSSEEELGKPIGSDSKNNKSTYVKLLGLDGAKNAASVLTDKACKELDYISLNTDFLNLTAINMLNRKS